jgi:hypothetical protein
MPRKPISVWIGQILIAASGLIFAGFLIYFSILQWPVIIRLTRAGANSPAMLVISGGVLAAKLAVLAFVASTVVLISKRSPLGRWFGLLCLALLFPVVVYANLYPSSSSYTLSYDNDAQRGGAFIAQVTVFAAFLMLMVRFGFSNASRAYFSGVNAAEPPREAGEK